jgi:hypothetical protein
MPCPPFGDEPSDQDDPVGEHDKYLYHRCSPLRTDRQLAKVMTVQTLIRSTDQWVTLPFSD